METGVGQKRGAQARSVETGGAVDSIYTDDSRRLGGFIAALVALLRSCRCCTATTPS